MFDNPKDFITAMLNGDKFRNKHGWIYYYQSAGFHKAHKSDWYEYYDMQSLDFAQYRNVTKIKPEDK